MCVYRIYTAYRIAAKTDRDGAILLASLNVSQSIETICGSNAGRPYPGAVTRRVRQSRPQGDAHPLPGQRCRGGEHFPLRPRPSTSSGYDAVLHGVCASRHTTDPRIELQSKLLPRLGTAANGGPLFVGGEKPMTTRRARTGNLLAMRAEAGKQGDRIPASRFPVQHEIQHLQNELNAFNDRIIELENEGHRGHAMEVLKAKAIDFARQIDELRCLLVRSQRS